MRGKRLYSFTASIENWDAARRLDRSVALLQPPPTQNRGDVEIELFGRPVDDGRERARGFLAQSAQRWLFVGLRSLRQFLGLLNHLNGLHCDRFGGRQSWLCYG